MPALRTLAAGLKKSAYLWKQTHLVSLLFGNKLTQAVMVLIN
jgi:hypothetical protein